MLTIVQEALTFDNVLLLPAYSTVLPKDVSLKTRLTRGINLNIPLVSAAMDTTGAGALIADWTVGLMGGSPSPLVVTAILFILSCGLTQFMSNTASAALLCPIGIAIAKQLGADPKAVLMAIAVAASCAFATPVGTPPNTLVLGPGGYKFMDYVKCGTGLVIVAFIVSLVVIPVVWPFFPAN